VALAAGFSWLIPVACLAQTAPSVSAADIYQRVHSSVVVVIVADRNSKPSGQGSGFITAKDRIVTNHHVLEGAEKALVVFADGTSEPVEGLAADSSARDLAILIVKTGMRAPLKLGDENSVRQGDPVYALGAPQGLELSLTNGIVSGFRDVSDQFLIQTTAPIAPGSSGGPLFDSSGRVVGVTTAFLRDSPGIYFSIGVGDVKRLLQTPNLVSTPFSVWSRGNKAEVEADAKNGTGENKAYSSSDDSTAVGDSQTPYTMQTWKNLRDGQTYRTRSNGAKLYLESIDGYPNTASDFINCDFQRAAGAASGWTGTCRERNPKDKSTYTSKATIAVFSETQIEGSTEYIPEFVLIPASAAADQNIKLVPSDSTSRGGIHITTNVIGATAVLHGAAGRVLNKCATPCSFNDLWPSSYSVEVQKSGYRSVLLALRVVAGVVWEQKVGLDELPTRAIPTNAETPRDQNPLAQGIYINSKPPGADVFINGAKQSGRTPLTLPLAPGQYNLVLRLPGYEAYAGAILVKENIQTRIDVQLAEKGPAVP
jgi:hypothetical protein